jgi:hypothetical protein
MPVPVRPLGSQGLKASAQGLGCMGEARRKAPAAANLPAAAWCRQRP